MVNVSVPGDGDDRVRGGRDAAKPPVKVKLHYVMCLSVVVCDFCSSCDLSLSCCHSVACW